MSRNSLSLLPLKNDSNLILKHSMPVIMEGGLACTFVRIGIPRDLCMVISPIRKLSGHWHPHSPRPLTLVSYAIASTQLISSIKMIYSFGQSLVRAFTRDKLQIQTRLYSKTSQTWRLCQSNLHMIKSDPLNKDRGVAGCCRENR